jgi:hypothetical protein
LAKSPRMVPLERAAEQLGVPPARLEEILRARGIAIVGRGKNARIAEADIELLSRPTRTIELTPEQRAWEGEFQRLRWERVGRGVWQADAKVVPFRPRPRKP